MRSYLQQALRDGRGIVNTRQHPELAQAARYAASRGQLVRLLPGLYAAPERADDFATRCLAVTSADPNAVLIEESAAHVWGWSRLPPTAVAAASQGLRSRPPWLVTSKRVIPSEHMIQRGEVRVTSRELTVLELAARSGGQPIDDALRRGITLDSLWQTCRSTPGHARWGAVRALLEDSRDLPWSEAERAAHRALREAGETGWEANCVVRFTEGVFAIDIAVRSLRLGFEVDSFAYHRERSSFDRDRLKDTALARADWHLVRVAATLPLEDPDDFVMVYRTAARNRRRNLARASRQHRL